MPSFEMPADLAQALYAYLITRPMQDVEGLVTGLRACKPIAQAVETEPKN